MWAFNQVKEIRDIGKVVSNHTSHKKLPIISHIKISQALGEGSIQRA